MIRASWILITPLLLLCVSGSAFQERGGREAPPPPRGGGSGHGGNRTPKPKPKASLLVNVTPTDSTIVLNEEIQRAENGTLERSNLAPGIYRMVVQREGYEPQTLQISLVPDTNTPFNVVLRLITGVLNIEPTVTGCQINVLDAETNALVGTYSGQVRNLELPPGRYQILVSKEGYRAVVRDVSVKAASTTLLEPSLEQLPRAPSPNARNTRNTGEPRFRPDAETQVRTSVTGKFIVVVINGRSGDTSNTLGTIDIKLTTGDGVSAYASGMLTGYPCQVDLVRLENVAEYSFVEPPGVGNQWSRIVVRIRPKSSKRPVHFAINWRNLGSVRASKTPPYSQSGN
ncbi:MAG: PEGA domain-containing protein [Pyrinomonadaceae bacterium]|nr:PEGA domain-containing protein [Pyrinomonadaceae bacterium]